MSNESRRPWYKGYKGHRIRIIITAIIAIIAAIISFALLPSINPALSNFSISVNPMQGDAQPGAVITTAITARGEHGYEESVSLSASGQPSGVEITFTPPIGRPTPAFTSNVIINVGSAVPTGSYEITIKGMGADGKEHTCQYILRLASISERVVNVSDAFSPLGWMGDWGDMILDYASTDNPYSEPTCIKITYSAAKSQGEGWAGIYWQYPDGNWGDEPGGRDLTGATKLTFWARGEEGGEEAEFKVGGITGKYSDSIEPPVSTGGVVLSDEWQQYTIDLAGKDLSHIIGGFCWVTNKDQNPYGCTIYLDDIRYEWIA